MSAAAALRADALQQLAQAEVLDPADAELVALSVAQLEAMDPEVLGERLQALGQEALTATLDALDNEQAVIASKLWKRSKPMSAFSASSSRWRSRCLNRRPRPRPTLQPHPE